MIRYPGKVAFVTGATGGIGRATAFAREGTKHGLIGLTESAALDDAAHGIRINAICPGIIDTETMRRFTGDTDGGRAAVIAKEPTGRMGRPARRDRGRGPLACARRKRRSPSATRWSSTAAQTT